MQLIVRSVGCVCSEWPLNECDNVVRTTMKWGSWPLEICRDNYLCIKPNIVAENLRVMVCIIVGTYEASRFNSNSIRLIQK